MEAKTQSPVEPFSAEEALFDSVQAIVRSLRDVPTIGLSLSRELTDLEFAYCIGDQHRGQGGWIIRRLQSIASTGRRRRPCSRCGQ